MSRTYLKETHSLTENEINLLQAIRNNENLGDNRHEYADEATWLEETTTWVECVCEPFGPSAGGIVASLVKKGFVHTDGETLGFTRAGANLAWAL